MKKVTADPSLGVSLNDHFAKPQNYSLDCNPKKTAEQMDVSDPDNFIEIN